MPKCMKVLIYVFTILLGIYLISEWLGHIIVFCFVLFCFVLFCFVFVFWVFVCLVWFGLVFVFSRQVFSVQSWLSWNSLCKPGKPRTQKSTCLCLPSAEIKGVRHHAQPDRFLVTSSISLWVMNLFKLYLLYLDLTLITYFKKCVDFFQNFQFSKIQIFKVDLYDSPFYF